MFAKLKKKVEESEGSDLHKLANSISSATASIAERTFSIGSVKSNENLASSQSFKGSTTSVASLSAAAAAGAEAETQQRLEAKWKQRFTELENEWRAKVIMKDHEREELTKEHSILVHHKKQLEDRIKNLESNVKFS